MGMQVLVRSHAVGGFRFALSALAETCMQAVEYLPADHLFPSCSVLFHSLSGISFCKGGLRVFAILIVHIWQVSHTLRAAESSSMHGNRTLYLPTHNMITLAEEFPSLLNIDSILYSDQ